MQGPLKIIEILITTNIHIFKSVTHGMNRSYVEKKTDGTNIDVTIS